MALTFEQKAGFDRDGFLILRGVFSEDEIAEIRDTFMTQNADGPIEGLSEIRRQADPSDPLTFYPRMMHPHRHPELPVGPLALRFMLDSRLHDALANLMDEEPLAAQSMFYFKPPGARGQDLHQDNFYLRVAPGNCLAAWLAVDDADAENGGMMVVPGSNGLEIACPEVADSSLSFTTDFVPIPDGLRAEPVTLKAGDVLFFNGSVIHGSSPNTSKNRFRRAFICHYVPESTAELAHWYTPIRFDTQETVTIADAVGGGPCGTPQMAMGPH